MYNTYVESDSARKVQRKFQCKFQEVTTPQRETIQRIVNKFRHKNQTETECY
jgi:hypothetical protein